MKVCVIIFGCLFFLLMCGCNITIVVLTCWWLGIIKILILGGITSGAVVLGLLARFCLFLVDDV